MENSPELQGLWKSVLDWVNKQFFQSGILHKRHAGPFQGPSAGHQKKI